MESLRIFCGKQKLHGVSLYTSGEFDGATCGNKTIFKRKASLSLNNPSIRPDLKGGGGIGRVVLKFPSPPKFEKEVRQIRSFYPDLGSKSPRTSRWSMYGLFTYMYIKSQPNEGKFTIHGCSGIFFLNHNLLCFLLG